MPIRVGLGLVVDPNKDIIVHHHVLLSYVLYASSVDILTLIPSHFPEPKSMFSKACLTFDSNHIN